MSNAVDPFTNAYIQYTLYFVYVVCSNNNKNNKKITKYY